MIDAKQLRREYLELHCECAVCGMPWLGHGGWCECHHLVGRGAGKECFDNYLTLCDACHRAYHRGHGVRDKDGKRPPEITPGMLIAAKRRVDPDFDEAALLALFRPDATEWPERWVPVDVPESLRRFP